MATNSQPQETPEYRTFREHYDRLVHAIQDPLPLATRLFTRSIIDPTLLQRVNVPALPPFQNTITLLSAVLGKIQTDPRMFGVFLSALNEDPSMQSLVESMESKCFVCCHVITWVPPNLECSRKKLFCQSVRKSPVMRQTWPEGQ